MHFNLPSQLAFEVASYDKTRKRLAATTTATTKKRNTYPNGRPFNMIPTDIVNDKTWAKIVEDINAAPATNKVQLITKPVLGEEPQPIAVVYYTNQLWIAAWLPRRKDDGYIYGMTIAYKDTAAARKQCTQKFFVSEGTLSKCMFNMRGDDTELLPRIKDGRTYWYRKTVFITKDDINNGYYGNYWKSVSRDKHYISKYGKTYNIHERIEQWETQLLKDIPTFANTSDGNVFQRLCDSECEFETIMSSYWSRPQWMHANDIYVHDVDNIIGKLNKYPDFLSRINADYMSDVYSAPWFRKMVLEAMRKTRALHDKMSNQLVYDKKKLKQPYAVLWQFIDSIQGIKCIYKDMDLNLLYSRYDWLCMTNMFSFHSETAHDWIRENVPVQSFINMLEQHYKHEVESKSYRVVDSATGNKHVYMHLWRDIYEMLTQCIAAERIDNLKPRRWRLQEWHDQLMAETWKINNLKVDLPQKLFPQPINVLLETSKYTFFQPVDTHQLAAWGRAVRNCVGGSHGYAEGVKKMKHLIILCMIDNAPRYTVQLTVDNGVMNVDQIADIGNKRLNDVERSNVENAFKQALQQRESQLN
jgi:hypothetical protein